MLQWADLQLNGPWGLEGIPCEEEGGKGEIA